MPDCDSISLVQSRDTLSGPLRRHLRLRFIENLPSTFGASWCETSCCAVDAHCGTMNEAQRFTVLRIGITADPNTRRFTVGTCRLCKTRAVTISDVVGFCADCIRSSFDEVWPEVKKVHDASRARYRLPTNPPRSDLGVSCPLCFQGCRIPDGGVGYCGVRRVEEGRLRGGRPHEGNVSFDYDPLPTNCVADFVCPGGSNCGYPKYSVTRGPEYGHRNLAVFYQACSFNCLYCQNYHFKECAGSRTCITAQELASAVDQRTTCICYFGGDPAPHILHALSASKEALRHAQDRILRICWETNGAVQKPFLKKMAAISLTSGGCIKFDLKAWSREIHHALCGVDNRHTFDNFRWLGQYMGERPEPPFLVAATLLVPGYVDEHEVAGIAAFLAEIDPDIPYRLLGFHPDYQLRDLPATSRRHAMRCKSIAEQTGLRRVAVGNVHILGDAYD